MIWGKNPERRVVMPAGALKFLKNDIRQNDLGQKPRMTGCHARLGMPCELLGAAQVAPWAPLGHPRGSKGSPRVSLGALSMARERSGGILGGARPAKSSVCIVNNISNADPRNSIPALTVAQNSSPDSADLRGSWPRTAARYPPNTRAGGQDDVSS